MTVPTMTGQAERPEHRSFSERFLAALKLEASVYEEVEHDPTALGQAAAVVAIAGLASGIGAVGVMGWTGILTGIVLAFVSWAVWTTIVWLVGVKVFDHTSDYGELLRALGFVAAPQVLYVLGLIPLGFVRVILAVVVLAMTIVAFVRAVRQALDVETGRAVFVSVLSVLVYVLIAALLGAVFG